METRNAMMALAWLDESQGEEGSETSLDEEVALYIRKSGMLIFTLFVICQVAMSVVFWWRSRNVKEINWLPKFIVTLASVEGIVWSLSDITEEFFKVELSNMVWLAIRLIGTITFPTILGLLIRFQRVQVQLRAREENTIKILKTIKQTSLLEKVFVMTLIFAQICDAKGYYDYKIFTFIKESKSQAWTISGITLDIAIVCMLS